MKEREKLGILVGCEKIKREMGCWDSIVTFKRRDGLSRSDQIRYDDFLFHGRLIFFPFFFASVTRLRLPVVVSDEW